MRPLRLELVGFGAFRSPTSVSFDDTDVVAFVGPTGAGKSTLIDAITFALFGTVARYGERDVAPVIHQLATEARVRLTFEVDGTAYDVVRVVRRTKTGASTKEARLERGAEVLAGTAREVDGEVKRLLGIDAGQFNTTVVLPQGRFADFLQAEPRYRQALLRDLLGLGVYARVGQAARQRAAERRLEVKGIDDQLLVLGDVSDDVLTAREREVARVGNVRVRVAELAAHLEALEAARRTAESELQRVVGSLGALESVRPPAGLAELSERLRTATEAATLALDRRDAAREQARGAARAAEAGPDASRAEAYLARRVEHTQVLSRLADATSATATATQTLAHAAARAEAVRASLAAAQRVVAAEREQRRVLEHVQGEQPAAADLEAQLAALADLDTRRRRAEAAETASADAASVVPPLRAHLEEATAARERAERLAPAASLATTLVVGEPCPVCEHPVAALPSAHRHDQRAVTRARAVERDAADALRVAEASAAEARAHAAATSRAVAELAVRLAGALPVELLQQALADAREREAELRAVDARVVAAERTLADLERAGGTQAALEAERVAEKELAAAGATQVSLQERGAVLERSLRDVPPVAELEGMVAEAHRLAAARRAAVAAEDHADAACEAAARLLEGVRIEESEARAAFGVARDTVAALGPPPSAGGDLPDEWAVLVGWAAELRTALELARTEHAATATRLTADAEVARAECASQSSGLVPAGWSSVADLREQLAAAEAAARAAHEAVVAARARATELASRRRQLEQDAAVAEQLGELLSASAFERWLLDEAMVDLVDRATVRLQALTGGQYSLVAEGGGFKVRDHSNADELRDARSLSGGETFLASLALALALGEATADLAAEGSARLESIFLDEGFGTLDADSLDVVASTIEELASSGRMVGLVTHIRELGERMPTRLEVRRTPTTAVVERVDR